MPELETGWVRPITRGGGSKSRGKRGKGKKGKREKGKEGKEGNNSTR
jgi:hypothetical protein